MDEKLVTVADRQQQERRAGERLQCCTSLRQSEHQSEYARKTGEQRPLRGGWCSGVVLLLLLLLLLFAAVPSAEWKSFVAYYCARSAGPT